jgi:hypothetical protein
MSEDKKDIQEEQPVDSAEVVQQVAESSAEESSSLLNLFFKNLREKKKNREK